MCVLSSHILLFSLVVVVVVIPAAEEEGNHHSGHERRNVRTESACGIPPRVGGENTKGIWHRHCCVGQTE